MGTSTKYLDRKNELLSSSEEVHGTRKDSRPSEGLDTHFLQRTIPKDKSLVEKPKNFVRGKEERIGPKEGKQPIGISSSLQKQESTSKSDKKGQKAPKRSHKGKKKAKSKWDKPYPQNYRIPKKEKTAMDNVFNISRTLMRFKNKEEERMNQFLPKK
ncbi:hypothetical protein O181_098328 [Austropuccinia psidii MF-1]|uniref:Uncharacterized protein n=1 Tax=Austropuccinia psidii MF-1 TaxID=1389203 RepID=A0A9Q3JAL6_9BASI|nr:hypothetical protein [Austropuccinia psidii MF-1]